MGMLNTTLNTKQLSIGYHHQTMINNINLELYSNECVMLLGCNGTGKTTLLKTLLGLIKPLKGDIYLLNKNLYNYHKQELASTISFVSTAKIESDFLNVLEFISLGRHPYTNWRATLQNNDKIIIEQAIELCHLQQFIKKPVKNLSDGERQRVLIARALAQDTSIMLLDEPTAFLDYPGKYEIFKLLYELSQHKNKLIIFSTHDFMIADKFANKSILIFPDKTIETHNRKHIINDQELINKLFPGNYK
jgi:iron complex transport system ATP-binding protein